MIASIFLASVLGLAASTHPDGGYYLRPCYYWNYDSGSNSYTCRHLDLSVYVATQDDVQQLAQLAQRQQQEIDRLTDRIQKLEHGGQ